MTGDVSASKKYYNIIQYGDILWAVGQGVEQHQDEGIDVHGSVSLSPSAHVMSTRVNFEGDTATVYAEENDPIDLGLRIRSGHSGYHALKYDVGAVRQVCSNGMMAFVADLHFEQTHGDTFQPGMAYQAVDGVINSPEVVEERIDEAQHRELMNQDEALLVLMDFGIDRFLQNPVPDLLNALHDEVESERPTLWETYNAATRALTHYTRGVPEYELDAGFEAAAQLLETGYSGVPEPDELGRRAVEDRLNEYVEDGEIEPYWDGEEDSLRELMETHSVAG